MNEPDLPISSDDDTTWLVTLALHGYRLPRDKVRAAVRRGVLHQSG